MGCTPSIHVNQTGVVYCRDSEESNSPHASYSATYHTHIVRAETSELASGYASVSSGRAKKKDIMKEISSVTTAISDVEHTSGQILAKVKMGSVSLSLPDDEFPVPQGNHKTRTKIVLPSLRRSYVKTTSLEQEELFSYDVLNYVNSDNEVQFGNMKLRQKAMSVLLVFAKEDAQSDGFWWAAEKMGYKCYIAHNSEGALECYLDKYHDLVIIDNRNNKNFDAEALCRSMRATKASEHSVIVAITKKLPPEKDEPSFLPLLKAGFNRKITENINAHACLNELISLEHGEVRSQLKLRACSALFSALDKVSDAVEITNEDHEIQYVNQAFEQMTGYSCEEVLGKDATEILKNDRNKTDIHDTINNQLKKGKYWEGTYYTRRKSGDTLGCHCHISPVLGPGGRISHIVTLKNSSHDPTHTERSKETDFTLANGGILHGIPRRKESLAKIHSMTIEAPITKVINIINAAQESSPITVVQALDKVLEILRTSELYSPYFQTMREDDPMTTDLVGGLVSQKMKKELSTTSQDVNSNSSVKSGHHSHTHIPISPINSLTQVSTNVQKILNTEPSWDFNIIELEVATNKRPLVYLGLKTMARFGVCEFLQTDELTFMNWLALIEANYHAVNPYHNSTHAADVLQASAYFLKCERNKMVLDHADQVACLIAAVIHDVDHPGRSNAFLINERNPLAVLYNDTAVLENHHAALGFQLSWKDDKVSIFKNLNRDEYSSLRENIIDMVLATEMKQHFEHLNKFVNSVNKSTLKMEDTSSMSGNGSPDSMSIMTQLCTPEIRKLIKRMLIKCADVSNPCRQLDLCKIWAIRIAEEYFQQTDDEKQRGLPVVMAVFDRKTCSIPNSQTRFIDVFINDMFDAWDYYCDISELITHLQNNYRYWKEKEEDGTKT